MDERDENCCAEEGLWSWQTIFNLSRGETAVLETAPATPPAIKSTMKENCSALLDVSVLGGSSDRTIGTATGGMMGVFSVEGLDMDLK